MPGVNTKAPVTQRLWPGYHLVATEIFWNRGQNRRTNARLFAEVVGDRQSKISRSKVDGHVQNFWPAITNRKRPHIGIAWSYKQSCVVAQPVLGDCGSRSRTIFHATGRTTWRLVVPPVLPVALSKVIGVPTGCTALRCVVPPIVRSVAWCHYWSFDRSQDATIDRVIGRMPRL